MLLLVLYQVWTNRNSAMHSDVGRNKHALSGVTSMPAWYSLPRREWSLSQCQGSMLFWLASNDTQWFRWIHFASYGYLPNSLELFIVYVIDHLPWKHVKFCDFPWISLLIGSFVNVNILNIFLPRHCHSLHASNPLPRVKNCYRPILELWSIVIVNTYCVFSALMLLVGWQEGHPAWKNGVVGCWHGYLSGARCRLAYSPAAIHCLLLQ